METQNNALQNGFFLLPGATSPSIQPLETMGVHLLYKAGRADTDGQWSLLEYLSPPSFRGVPPHWHKETIEAFYILEGRLAVNMGDQAIEAGTGSFVMIPRRVVHSWHNPVVEPTKFLVLTSPGGFEHYMEELIDWMGQEPTWPPSDMSKYVALGEKHDTFAPPAPADKS
ncbi:MAG: cupin domain-containing protein [Abitibacteriaceae bacterium]|nr:cupin domain-containing protein [Abditibacteriaceae bacterium]